MMPRTLTTALLAAAIVAGCEQPYMGPSPGLADPYPAPYNDPQITILNREITNWVRFDPARIRGGADTPMHVEVPARNTTDNLYLIQYRFVFRNADGFELEPQMSWHREALRPRQTVYLKGSALSSEAVNYKLEVKWAQ